MIKIEVVGDVCVASGFNWTYERVGNAKIFKQTGKVASIRTIKTMIKLIIKEGE